MASDFDGLSGRLRETLAECSALVASQGFHVPPVPRTRDHQFELASTPLHSEALRATDTVLIVIGQLRVDCAPVLGHAPLVGDTHNATCDIRGGCRKVVKA